MLRNKFNKVFPWPGYNGDFADDVLGFDPNGGGIYDIPLVGDAVETVVENPALLLLAAPFAIPALAGATAGAAAAGGAAAGTTASAMLAVQSAELMAAGFTAAEVATSLAGLGSVAEIGAIMTAAGVSAAEASALAADVMVNDAAQTAFAQAAGSAEGQAASQTFSYESTPQVGTGTPLEPLPGTEIGYTDAEYAAMDSYGLDNYAVTPQEAGINEYLYDPMYADYPEGLGESVDVGNVPSNAGVPAGGWPADYGSEWGVGAPIGTGLTGLGLNGLQNPLMTELQNAVNIPSNGSASLPGGDGQTGLGSGGYNTQSLGGGLASLLGAGLNYWNTQEGADRLAEIAQNMDPYWDYRGGTQIPMMQQAAGSAGTLGNLYQQSYTDPLSVYNRPEMQALNQKFMQETERRDAALGRNSQYGARGVQAQNQFLTNALPQYRTGLQQGLSTLYNAATPQPYDQDSAQSALLQSTIAQNQQIPSLLSTLGGSGTGGSGGTSGGSYSGSGGGSSSNPLGQVQQAVNTGQALINTGNTLNNAWNTLSSWF